MMRRASSGMLAPLPVGRLVVALGVLLAVVVVSPGQALTLTTSGSGLTPCGEELCLDLSWRWSGTTSDPAGETTLVLPVPDSNEWSLSGGSISSFGDTVAFSGTFDRSDPAYIPPGGGHATARLLTLGADGTLLTENSSGLTAFCQEGNTSQVTCSDANGTPDGSHIYHAAPGDDSILSALTLSYDFAPVWRSEPLSFEFHFDLLGSAHLVYSPIPEPSAALIMAVGLLTVAATRLFRA